MIVRMHSVLADLLPTDNVEFNYFLIIQLFWYVFDYSQRCK